MSPYPSKKANNSPKNQQNGSLVPIDKNTIYKYTMGSFVISVDHNVGKYLGLPADYLAYYPD